jgi:hypothetical protein
MLQLEKRKGRGGGGGGGGGGSNSIEDTWGAPALVKTQMAFEIIWFCIILYLITVLLKSIRNVPARQRQPYILLLISAIFLDASLIMRAIEIRTQGTTVGPTSLALNTATTLLWHQPMALITMAGLWVFRKRSKLITYGGGAKGIPYAGKTWKFVADWVVTSCGLLFLVLAVIVNAAGYSLGYNRVISYSDYERYYNAQVGLLYVEFAFNLILTIVFVVTGFKLSSAFKRQMGHPDVVRHFRTHLRTLLTSMQVTRQMLIWVMPWLIIRALDILVDIIIRGTGTRNITYDVMSLALSTVIVNGACWCMVLYGFIKTAAVPGPWDWSHLQANQPEMAPYSVQATPPQPGYYTPPSGPPQGWSGQNNSPQQHVYQPYTPPPVKV